MVTGMTLALDTFGKDKRIPGILIGAAGLAMMCVNYPIYQKKLDERKKQYAQKILDLSDNMIFEEE